MDDLELSRRLRNARPRLPERGDPLSVTAEATLSQILEDQTVPARRRRSPISLSVAAAIAVLLVMAIGFVYTMRPAPVYAVATPPLLEPTPVDGTSKDLLMQLSSNLEEGAGTIRFQSWSLAMTVGDDSTLESVAIEPEVRTVEHREDGSRIEVRRGEPYDSFGNPLHVDGYEIGELVWEQDFPAGDFPFVFTDPLPIAAQYDQFLRQPTGASSMTTGDYLRQLNSLLGERKLTLAQTRAALEFLATLQGLEVEGRVVDRLGRAGISFATDSRTPGEYVDRVIVSDEGLGFLSFETTYVGHNRTDIQAPAVVSYTAWE
jgi:hypothetical protein